MCAKELQKGVAGNLNSLAGPSYLNLHLLCSWETLNYYLLLNRDLQIAYFGRNIMQICIEIPKGFQLRVHCLGSENN